MSTEPEGWEGYLEPGETILWQGRLNPAEVRIPSDRGRRRFGLLFGGFGLLWTALAEAIVLPITWGTGDWLFPLVFFLFGLPFIVTGFAIAFFGPRLRARRLARTWYTLTDRRGFISTDRMGRRLKSFRFDRRPELERTPAGDIVTFGTDTYTTRDSKGRTRRRTVPVAFELIEDGPAVLALIETARAQKDPA